MKNKNPFLGKQVVLTNWDWPNQNGPRKVKGKIVNVISEDKLLVDLYDQLNFVDDSHLNKIVISSRHQGYPLIKALPNKFFKNLPLPAFILRLIIPLVAVNIYTEDNRHISIAILKIEE